MPARAACHRHPLRARLRPRRPPPVPGESGGSPRRLAIGSGRKGSVGRDPARDQWRAAPGIGPGSRCFYWLRESGRSTLSSPTRGEGWLGNTRAGGVNCALRRGRLRGRGRPQWRGRVLQQLLLGWRVVRSHVGLVNSEGVRWGRPRGRISHPAAWRRTPDPTRESANLALTAAVRSLCTRKATGCTFFPFSRRSL